MTFHIITLFPKAFDSYLGESILKRAIEDKKIKVKFYNPRDFTKDKNHRVDQKPYGGGPGMVIEALPVIKAIEKALGRKVKDKGLRIKDSILWLTPSGKQFDNKYADKLVASKGEVAIVCGRYEGIDARVKKVYKVQEVSVGPFILTGGELPAMLIMDVVARRLPGVLGNLDSVEEKRVASPDVYTRPEVLEYKKKKYRVPKVLLSGHHKNIDAWRDKRKRK